MPIRIDSPSNPRVKAIARLRQASHRKRENLMLIEGPRCVDRALRAGVRILQACYCPARFAEAATCPAVVEALGSARVELLELSEPAFEKLAYRHNPEGLVVVARPPGTSLDALPGSVPGLVVLAEGLEKPGNLGAICRSADGAGADAVILCDRHTDVWNPNAVMASTGAVFSVPIAQADLPDVLAWVRARNVRILAATPDAAVPYTRVDLTGPVALALGSEHAGLSQALLDAADQRISIPMRGRADSLNVATTAAVLLFEAARQRGEPST